MKLNTKIKLDRTTGFGSETSTQGGRFVNSDGHPNVTLQGASFLDTVSWYHTLLSISRLKFLALVFAFYFLINLVFATVYYCIGVDHLRGITAVDELDRFGQAFFFSIQTYTTVGYGHINPSGFLTSFVAAIEALFGLLSFAIATGLFYGRFSKPKAYIQFSKNALISPFKDGTALMFRVCPSKNTDLTDVEAKITLAYQQEEKGVKINKFYPLELEYAKINTLTLSWTVVHPITENSPLFGLTEADFKSQSGEIIIIIKSFEEMFSTSVSKRTSYLFSDIVYGAQFEPMFSRDDNKSKTILHLEKLNLQRKALLIN